MTEQSPTLEIFKSLFSGLGEIDANYQRLQGGEKLTQVLQEANYRLAILAMLKSHLPQNLINDPGSLDAYNPSN